MGIARLLENGFRSLACTEGKTESCEIGRNSLQWPRRDSNPHRDYSPRDFKSLVSAIPPLGRRALVGVCPSACVVAESLHRSIRCATPIADKEKERRRALGSNKMGSNKMG